MPNPTPMLHPNFDFEHADTNSINRINQETLSTLQKIKPAASEIAKAVHSLALNLGTEMDKMERSNQVEKLNLLLSRHKTIIDYLETSCNVANSAARKIRDYEATLGPNRSVFAKFPPRWFRSIDFDHTSAKVIVESNKLHSQATHIDNVVTTLNEMGIPTTNPVTPLLRNLPLVEHLRNP